MKSDLNFNNQITTICQKVINKANAVNPMEKLLDQNLKQIIVRTFVLFKFTIMSSCLVLHIQKKKGWKAWRVQNTKSMSKITAK